MRDVGELVSALPALAARLTRAGALLSGEAAAHAHLVAATATVPGEPARYAALPPRRVEAVLPAGARPVDGVEEASSPVVEALRPRLDLFSTTVVLGDGTMVPVLSLEAVLAELLGRGGLALGLAGLLVRLCGRDAVDVDGVREILKAARQGERFQPLLELMEVA